MKIALIVVGVLAGVVVAFVVWRYIATALGGDKVRRRILEKISPVPEMLDEGQTPDPVLLQRFAGNVETCKVLWETLDAFGRLELFPGEYRQWEHLAKADLVFWLCHPNELTSPPDEIEVMATVDSPSSTAEQPAQYFVFRYRVNEPHWAAKDGWMAGVAGPYGISGDPQPHGQATFSRFEAYDSRTPEEHVHVTHEALFGKQN